MQRGNVVSPLQFVPPTANVVVAPSPNAESPTRWPQRTARCLDAWPGDRLTFQVDSVAKLFGGIQVIFPSGVRAAELPRRSRRARPNPLEAPSRIPYSGRTPDACDRDVAKTRGRARLRSSVGA